MLATYMKMQKENLFDTKKVAIFLQNAHRANSEKTKKPKFFQLFCRNNLSCKLLCKFVLCEIGHKTQKAPVRKIWQQYVLTVYSLSKTISFLSALQMDVFLKDRKGIPAEVRPALLAAYSFFSACFCRHRENGLLPRKAFSRQEYERGDAEQFDRRFRLG